MSGALTKPGVAQVRADLCHDCPAPCAWQRAADHHADLCAACPSGRWPADGDCSKMGDGDRAAAWIEAKILGPAERAVPAAKGLIEKVRRCGGCAADKARLNGDGGGGAI